MNYYNEIEPFAVAWLRLLIAAGELPAGDVDDRPIQEIKPDDLKPYTQCHFFAGIGGWPLALKAAGIDPARPVWSGSCPCQPLSSAGRQRGHEDDRHLWPAWFKLIAVCRPPVLIGEQVASRLGREWLAGVFDDLETLAYACAGADLCAAGVGASHIRQRLFWCAHADQPEFRCEPPTGQQPRDEQDGGGVRRCADAKDAIRRRTGNTDNEGRRTTETGGSSVDVRSNADTERDGGRTDQPGRGEERRAAAGRAIQRREHAERDGREQRRTESDRRGAAGGRSDVRGSHDAEQPRLEGHAGDGDRGDQPGRFDAASNRSVAPAGTWDDYTVAVCRDIDKRTGRPALRRVGRGVQPLAYGIPANMGSLVARLGELGVDPKTARRIIALARRNRGGRLRGYGNAIVPVLGAVFARAMIGFE